MPCTTPRDRNRSSGWPKSPGPLRRDRELARGKGNRLSCLVARVPYYEMHFRCQEKNTFNQENEACVTGRCHGECDRKLLRRLARPHTKADAMKDLRGAPAIRKAAASRRTPRGS